MLGRDRSQTRDALPARRKRVTQLAGHGDHVTVSMAELIAEGVERSFQAVESEPKRGRRRNDPFDAALLHARGLQMRSADIPADDDAHRSSQAFKATLDPN